jgi:hypothetical protein
MGYGGLGGAFLFAVGGTILFAMLYVLNVLLPNYQYQTSGSIIAYIFISFIGFLMLGFGLWLIVEDGKVETKQTPS